MAVVQGESAVQQLVRILRKKDEPDDPGLLAEAGDALDEVFARIRANVERNGKACTGDVTLKIKVKGYRSKGNEVAVDLSAGVSHKAPAKPVRETVLFLDHDGHAHTTPQQEEMPLFDPKTAKVVEGGKDKSDSAPKARGKAV